MRTKTLLLAAATLAVSLVTSQAQVYSGIVGYSTLSLTNGFNLICNPLDDDGTGTNNTLQTVFSTNLPNATAVYIFSAGSWQHVTYVASTGKWLGNGLTNLANAALNPGFGVMVQVPASPATNVVVPLVGNVLQGSFTNPIPAGLQIVSCVDPLSGTLDTNLMYAPTKQDKVYTWNSTIQNYNSVAPTWSGTTWLGGDPNLQVAQPIFLNAKSNTVWIVNFTAQ